ncbi:serine protease [Orbilia ellipsospora]|uniref:Serine protease n=1 Tax=Orbilia ellipsospora TaxID=2528407 RepID=A0AAV9XFL5_9PEZI
MLNLKSVLFILLAGLVAITNAAVISTVLQVLNTDVEGIIQDKFLIIFKPTVSEADATAHMDAISAAHSEIADTLTGAQAAGIGHKFRFANGLAGYTAGLPGAVLQIVLTSPLISSVEQDVTMQASFTQTNATWGLDRISHRHFTNQGAGHHNYSYNDNPDGSGVTVYVVDSGIYLEHSEFEGRATWGANFIDNDDTDKFGHGTHCAGTVGGKTYGVAKKVNLVAVKVLNAHGQGEYSGFIAALNWITDNATPNKSVVNMSLGGPHSAAVNAATQAVIDKGITVVAAAGNKAKPAGTISPASVTDAITVGAVNNKNLMAYFSNYGSVLDVFAPGVGVKSAWITGPTSTRVEDGTSMACPHVAGLAAYVISNAPGGTLAPNDVAHNITAQAVKGQIKGREIAIDDEPVLGLTEPFNTAEGSPNLIVYNGYLG